jgi:oligopeptide transport system ATP-binding protein
MDKPLLSVEHLHVNYPSIAGGTRPAVRGVSFEIERGRTLGLLGESGSGKSSIARALLRLAPVSAGRIQFAGQRLDTLSDRQFFAWRKHMQLVFQDPYASLNPRQTVRQIIAEPLEIHFPRQPLAVRQQRIDALLEAVGLDPARQLEFPAAFSGGQRQRMVIARALAVEPELLICDEPVSALDVSLQAQVLALLKDLQARLGLTLLFISHDLAVVAQMCDHIAVMRHGLIVEAAAPAQLYRQPAHPYTQALIDASVPRPLTGTLADAPATQPACQAVSQPADPPADSAVRG